MGRPEFLGSVAVKARDANLPRLLSSYGEVAVAWQHDLQGLQRFLAGAFGDNVARYRVIPSYKDIPRQIAQILACPRGVRVSSDHVGATSLRPKDVLRGRHVMAVATARQGTPVAGNDYLCKELLFRFHRCARVFVNVDRAHVPAFSACGNKWFVSVFGVVARQAMRDVFRTSR